MDTGLLKLFRKIIHREKIKFSQKLLIFLFFILVSTIFWFLNALSKDYNTTISYPVHFTNFPKDKILVNKLPSHILLHVNSYGFTLLQHKLKKSLLPIIFNVNSFALNKVPLSNHDIGTSKFYILTSLAKQKIANQLSSEIKIIDISPDTLIFQFANIIKKKVRVKPMLKIDFEKQFMLKGKITIHPDSIILSGPYTILDTIDRVKTKYYFLNKLNKTIKKNLEICDIKNVKFSKKRVIVKVPVEKYTEASLNVQIEVKNLPDSLYLKTFPNDVKISYLVGFSNYDKTKPHHFKAIVDYKSIENNLNNKKIKVKIVKFPRFINSMKHYPKNVEYIILLKE